MGAFFSHLEVHGWRGGEKTQVDRSKPAKECQELKGSSPKGSKQELNKKKKHIAQMQSSVKTLALASRHCHENARRTESRRRDATFYLLDAASISIKIRSRLLASLGQIFDCIFIFFEFSMFFTVPLGFLVHLAWIPLSLFLVFIWYE
jgi:hypothetical protein